MCVNRNYKHCSALSQLFSVNQREIILHGSQLTAKADVISGSMRKNLKVAIKPLRQYNQLTRPESEAKFSICVRLWKATGRQLWYEASAHKSNHFLQLGSTSAEWIRSAKKQQKEKKNRNKIQSTLAGGNMLPIKNKGVAGTDQWESRQRVISTWSLADWLKRGAWLLGGVTEESAVSE